MLANNGLVLALPPTAGPALAVHLGDRDGGALAARSCSLELVADTPGNPNEMHAIVSWRRAVPLKIERLVMAVMAAGGVLRRDLDADELREQAVVSGYHVARVGSVADLEAFGAGPTARHGDDSLLSSAA